MERCGDTLAENEMRVPVTQLAEILMFAIDGIVRLERKDPAQSVGIPRNMWLKLIACARIDAEPNAVPVFDMWEAQL